MSAIAVELAWGAMTDRGRRRAVNEDSYLAESPVFLVADGIGGHDAGAEASQRAIGGFQTLVGRPSVTVEEMQSAFSVAVRNVGDIATSQDRAGTTLTGVAVCEQLGEPYWLVLNIGDSRTYRLFDGELEQISIDHSAVQALVDSGEIQAHEAESHPHRNVVTRAVGAGSTGEPDYWLLPVVAGERIMLCSDGLTKEVDVDRMRDLLLDESDPQRAAARLVAEALRSGGRDNVTVVVVDVRVEAPLELDDLDVDTVPRFADTREVRHVDL